MDVRNSSQNEYIVIEHFKQGSECYICFTSTVPVHKDPVQGKECLTWVFCSLVAPPHFQNQRVIIPFSAYQSVKAFIRTLTRGFTFFSQITFGSHRSMFDPSFQVHVLFNCGRIFFSLYYHFSLVISYLSV